MNWSNGACEESIGIYIPSHEHKLNSIHHQPFCSQTKPLPAAKKFRNIPFIYSAPRTKTIDPSEGQGTGIPTPPTEKSPHTSTTEKHIHSQPTSSSHTPLYPPSFSYQSEIFAALSQPPYSPTLHCAQLIPSRLLNPRGERMRRENRWPQGDRGFLIYIQSERYGRFL